MFVVDTNILLHAVNEDDHLFGPCRDRLEEWRSSTGVWFLTWGIVYEFLRVVTHPGYLPEPWSGGGTWDFVVALLESPGLGVLTATERHVQVALEVADSVPYLAGNIWHDAHTAILMREHGIRRIYTRDMDFHRFPFLEVVDPTA